MSQSLRSVKSIVNFMKANNVKKFAFNGIEVEFNEPVKEISQELIEIPPIGSLDKVKTDKKALEDHNDNLFYSA